MPIICPGIYLLSARNADNTTTNVQAIQQRAIISALNGRQAFCQLTRRHRFGAARRRRQETNSPEQCVPSFARSRCRRDAVTSLCTRHLRFTSRITFTCTSWVRKHLHSLLSRSFLFWYRTSISQGSVATCLRLGVICNGQIYCKFSDDCDSEKNWKSVNIWERYGH